MKPKNTVKRLLILSLVVPFAAVAGPVYDLDDYGVVVHKRTNTAIPYLQINAGYGKFDNREKTKAVDYSVGANLPVATDYRLDIAVYHSYLGKQNNFKVKGYGLKTSLKSIVSEKSSLSIGLGAGFSKYKQVEGAQLSMGLGYEYLITPGIAWNLNVEHYFHAANSDTKWTGGNTGLRFYLN